jgi:MraZ protein
MIDLVGQLGFTGNFEMSIDSKGRATTPAPMVRVLQTRYAEEGGALVATVSLDRSVSVMPVSEWLALMKRLEELPDLDENSRKVHRLMSAYSFQVALDSSNRVRLPAQLLELCGIGKEVSVIGQRDHFEVWDRKAWSAFSSDGFKTISESAQKALAR